MEKVGFDELGPLEGARGVILEEGLDFFLRSLKYPCEEIVEENLSIGTS
jgi:hypothetical protein